MVRVWILQFRRSKVSMTREFVQNIQTLFFTEYLKKYRSVKLLRESTASQQLKSIMNKGIYEKF